MSPYGIFMILLPISMAGVLAMPGHNHKSTLHRRHHNHGHSQEYPDHLSVDHPIRHRHHHHLTSKDFDDKELDVLSLEESQNEYRKRDQRHNGLGYVVEEQELKGRFKAKCGYTVEVVPCTGNSCTKKYLRHIKCNHTGESHGNGYCIQTFRKVKLNCSDPSENSTHLFTGCVFATAAILDELPSAGTRA